MSKQGDATYTWTRKTELDKKNSDSNTSSKIALKTKLTLLRYSLAFVWMATALFSFFIVKKEVIIDLFLSAGIAHDTHLQTLLFYSATLLDFILGFTLLINYRIQFFGRIQIAMIAFYTIFLGISDPQWFFHPYGPLIKNIPLILATYLVITENE